MHDDRHDLGLAHDLYTMKLMTGRRRLLRMMAGASLLPFVGCVQQNESSTSDNSGSAGTTSGGECSTIPEETAGPYPGDGSNGPNALTMSGIVRSDIRASFGDYSGVADGVPLEVRLNLVQSNAGCAPLAGYALYLWHCDRDGLYSLYTAQAENYLRGVQESDDDGVVRFTTIFPGCYPGRWPHMHFEIYPALDSATAAGNRVATSQLALPQSICEQVYAIDGYAASATNLAGISLATDNVFSEDSAALQLATLTGSISDGYVAELTVAITD